MRTNILRLLIIFFVFSVSSCSTTVDVKNYICPKLPNSDIALYEFENSNEAIYPIKYLLIEQRSIERDVFLYTFLNADFDLVNGFKERRKKDKTVFVNMIVLEANVEQTELHTHNIDIEDYNFNYSFEINKVYTQEFEWDSYYSKGGKFTNKSTRKLESSEGSFLYRNNEIPVVVFTGNDKTKVVSPESPIIQTSEAEIVVKYGLDIGVVYMKMSFSSGAEAILTLKGIFYGKEVEEIMNAKEMEF